MQKLFMAISLLLAAAVVCPGQVTSTQYPVPTNASRPLLITTGPDGNLWFTERHGDKIGQITPTGFITEFPLQTGSEPYGITAGPDGNLWFTELSGNKIGKISTAGQITEYIIPTATSYPTGITQGPDGNLWFVEQVGKVGRITTARVITEFSGLTGYNSYGITAGSDHNLWFTEYSGGKIGSITTAGVTAEFSLPSGVNNPVGITAGPDGNLWFAVNNCGWIGKITTAGAVAEFSVPTNDAEGITGGPDNNLWIADYYGTKVDKINIGSRYSLCLLYDPTKAVRSGATVPIKLQLCNGNGNDLSSSSITLYATSITQVSNSISGPVQDSGNANPDFNFRFDSTLGSSGGYIFNFSTKGLVTGSYTLNFTVTGDSFVYAAPFQVK